MDHQSENACIQTANRCCTSRTSITTWKQRSKGFGKVRSYTGAHINKQPVPLSSSVSYNTCSHCCRHPSYNPNPSPSTVSSII